MFSVRMLGWWTVGVSASLLFAGCSGDSAPRVSGTVPIASTAAAIPVVTDSGLPSDSSVVTSLPTYVATTIPVATVVITTPRAATTTIGLVPAANWGPEEAKIAYVIEQYFEAYWTERATETFDLAVLVPLIEGEFLENRRLSFEKDKANSQQIRKGSFLQTILVEVDVTGDDGTALACHRNDWELWDTNGTNDRSDDSAVETGMTREFFEFRMSRSSGSWRVSIGYRDETRVSECDAVF
jgi:hypothetical protein